MVIIEAHSQMMIFAGLIFTVTGSIVLYQIIRIIMSILRKKKLILAISLIEDGHAVRLEANPELTVISEEETHKKARKSKKTGKKKNGNQQAPEPQIQKESVDYEKNISDEINELHMKLDVIEEAIDMATLNFDVSLLIDDIEVRDKYLNYREKKETDKAAENRRKKEHDKALKEDAKRKAKEHVSRQNKELYGEEEKPQKKKKEEKTKKRSRRKKDE